MGVRQTADYNQMNVGWLSSSYTQQTFVRRLLDASHSCTTRTWDTSDPDSAFIQLWLDLRSKIASDGELSSALSSFMGHFHLIQITPDTPDTDLIVDKHKSDSSDCGTVGFRGWSEEINLASDEWTMSKKAQWNRGICSFIGRFHLIRPRQTRQTTNTNHSLDCDTIVFHRWPEEINLASDEWRMSQNLSGTGVLTRIRVPAVRSRKTHISSHQIWYSVSKSENCVS